MYRREDSHECSRTLLVFLDFLGLEKLEKIQRRYRYSRV